jgi:hypothetical protein
MRADRSGQRGGQLPAGAAGDRLRHQRCAGEAPVRRAGVRRGGRADPGEAAHRRAGGRRAHGVRGLAGRAAARSRDVPGRGRRLLRAALHVGHHRLPQGRDAHPRRDARPRQRSGGRLRPLPRRDRAGRDAAVPRRRHELRAAGRLVRRAHGVHADARPGRDPGDVRARPRHPHVPGARADGGDGPGPRRGRPRLLVAACAVLRRVADAAARHAREPEAVPGRAAPGLRHDRGLRRGQLPRPGRPPRPRRRAPARLGGHAHPRASASRSATPPPAPRCPPARPARSGCTPTSS